MSSANPSASPIATAEEQLALALQRAALEDVLSTTRVYVTACFAIFSWDFIITFPDEYRTVWKAQRWTPIRAFFFFNRYWGLLYLSMAMCLLWSRIDPRTCDKVHLLEPVGGSILIFGSEFLLGARVWAMFNRRRWIIWFFGTFAICALAIEIWAILPNRALRVPSGLRGCLSVGGGQNYIWAFWIPPLLYDTTATIFALVPLIAHWRKTPRTRLLTIFARDGVLYFCVVFICNLINVIYFSIPTVANPVLNGPLTFTFTTMMASHLVLHLRTADVGANSRDGGTSGHSASRGRNTIVQPFASPNQLDKGAGPEIHLQKLRRRMEGDLQVGYDDLIVNIETVADMEKRPKASPDLEAHDEYPSSEYSVRDTAKN
ncbi:hypothetical protein BT69DRAFT_1350104 [Atractiella rhizophila]|nr:hypothetical protein BT69DRAFT_1350104 [Atractiella rhizophila]